MPPPRDANPVKLVRKRLDAAGLEAHVQDLVAHARDVEIRVKGAVAGYSQATTETLDVVRGRLLAGELVAVQIRYLRDDVWWSDTIMAGDNGFRLVRMREGA